MLLGLAEQFGTALQTGRGGALRRSALLTPEDRQYSPQSDADAHDLGEILVAVIMNTFLKVWCSRIQAIEPVQSGSTIRYDLNRVVEEGCKSARHCLNMVVRAIDYTPPIDVNFPDFFAAMMTADAQTVPDDRYGYRTILEQTMNAYGIERPPTALANGQWEPLANPHDLIQRAIGHAEMQWDRQAVFRFVWENIGALKLDERAFTFISSVRPVVRFGPNGFIVRETVAECVQLFDMRADELGDFKVAQPHDMPNDQPVRLRGGSTLVFDDYGMLKYAIGNSVTNHEEQSRRLARLWATGAMSSAFNKEPYFSRLHRERATRVPDYERERW